MKPKSLNQHVNEFYQQTSLSNVRIQALLARTHVTTNVTSPQQSTIKTLFDKWFNLNRPMLITVCLLLLVVPISIPLYQATTEQTYALQTIIAQEIALNHRKQLGLEFNVDNYKKLNTQMKKLDFELIASIDPALNDLTIIGARYCSIQGYLAAQIRFTNPQGQHYTLYQTTLPRSLLTHLNVNQIIDDIEVTQWSEGDTFYGLATRTQARNGNLLSVP